MGTKSSGSMRPMSSQKNISATMYRLENETEEEFQTSIIAAATLTGWLHYHTHDSRRSPAGFPDLVLAHPTKGVLFLECKRQKGEASPAQLEWIATLKAAGQCAEIVKPIDWHWITEVLNHGPIKGVDYGPTERSARGDSSPG